MDQIKCMHGNFGECKECDKPVITYEDIISFVQKVLAEEITLKHRGSAQDIFTLYVTWIKFFDSFNWQLSAKKQASTLDTILQKIFIDCFEKEIIEHMKKRSCENGKIN